MVAASVPSTVGVSFLSENKKKELTKKIIDARKEWLQTAGNICVEQVAEEVGAGAAFTSDYLMFTTCAACVATIGLATDSATTTIASMLISPIMGPVMGFTLATTIREKQLCLISLRNEAFSIAICIIIWGAFWGVIAAVARASMNRDWPTVKKCLTVVTNLASQVEFLSLSLLALRQHSARLVGTAVVW
jgi:hypothetical protein